MRRKQQRVRRLPSSEAADRITREKTQVARGVLFGALLGLILWGGLFLFSYWFMHWR